MAPPILPSEGNSVLTLGLMFFLLGQVPDGFIWAGLAMSLAGIAIAARRPRRRPVVEAPLQPAFATENP